MTAAILESPSNQILAHKDFIEEKLWNRLVGRIVLEEAIERSLAERILDQTLAFVKLRAQNPGQSYSPSPLVDIGWHNFILYTKEYAAFCAKLGTFVHHEPRDVEGVDYGSNDSLGTVNALKEQNFVVDEALWPASGLPRCE